jgi:hypothetical protein
MLQFSKITFVVLLLNGVLFAEYYGYLQIAEVPTNPRISAMGSAGTALSGGGFSSYNPASPAFAEVPFLSLEYGNQPGDFSKSKIETSWMFPRWFAGASLVVHTTDWQMANEQGVGGMSSYQSLLATLTGGYIWGRFAAGNSLNFLQERVGDQTWHAFTYSPGILFQLVPNSITIGASLSHYLRFDTTGSPWYKTPMVWYRAARGFPRYARAGIAWRDTVERWTLPFTMVCDFVYSDVYEKFMVPLGAEVWVLPSLAARAGLYINHPTEIVHFGVGIRLNFIEFDFDYGISQLVSDATPEAKWMFGLTYSLQKKKPAPVPVQKPKKADSTAIPMPDIREPIEVVPVLQPVTDSVKIHVPKAETSANTALDISAIPPDSSSIIPSSSGTTVSPGTGTSSQPAPPAPAVLPKDSLSFPSGVRDTVKK